MTTTFTPPKLGAFPGDDAATAGVPWNYQEVCGQGHIFLEDYMGSDLSVVNNARISFGQQEHTLNLKDKGLINFLIREKHGSPFESVTFRFDIMAPIFVVREWHRHRAGHSYNEWSGRYMEIPDPMGYIPKREDIREMVPDSKPGAYKYQTIESDSTVIVYNDLVENSYKIAFETYRTLLDLGAAKEIARVVLPVGMFTRFKWTCNLRSALHFISLRNSEHAQREIRYYGVAVEKLIGEICPTVLEKFIEHGRVAP